MTLGTVAAAGCGGDDGGTPQPDGNPGAVTLSPASANVLTCSTTQYTATNDPAQGAWSADAGSITQGGLYSSPLSVPADPDATVSYAPSTGAAAVHATAHLATAFPGTPVNVDTNFTVESSPYEHLFTASGMRTYAALLDGDSGVRIRRSDDAGATFTAKPTLAIANVKCATAAVDAGNPDVLYIVAHHTTESPGGDDTSVTLYVSEDGGATFPAGKRYVLGDSILDGLATMICPDVVSPSPDHVVVASARQNGDQTFSWTGIYYSANRGVSFGTGSGNNSDDYHSPADVNTANTFADGTVLSDGGQNGPRVFSDGKGNVCAAYAVDGETCADNSGCNGMWVQCSTDAGATWSAAHELATTRTATFPTGAISPTGDIAVTWTEKDANGDVQIELAISHDHGATYGAKVQYPFDKTTYGYTADPIVQWDGSILWLMQTTAGADAPLVVMDKTCDFGATWSGSIAITQPSDYYGEALIVTAHGVAAAARNLRDDAGRPLSIISLAP